MTEHSPLRKRDAGLAPDSPPRRRRTMPVKGHPVSCGTANNQSAQQCRGDLVNQAVASWPLAQPRSLSMLYRFSLSVGDAGKHSYFAAWVHVLVLPMYSPRSHPQLGVDAPCPVFCPLCSLLQCSLPSPHSFAGQEPIYHHPSLSHVSLSRGSLSLHFSRVRRPRKKRSTQKLSLVGR